MSYISILFVVYFRFIIFRTIFKRKKRGISLVLSTWNCFISIVLYKNKCFTEFDNGIFCSLKHFALFKFTGGFCIFFFWQNNPKTTPKRTHQTKKKHKKKHQICHKFFDNVLKRLHNLFYGANAVLRGVLMPAFLSI